MMADTFSLDILKNLLNTLSGSQKDAVSKFIKSLEDAKETMFDMAKATESLGSSLANHVLGVAKAQQAWLDFTNIRDRVIDSSGGQFEMLSQRMKNFGEEGAVALAKPFYTIEPLIGLLPKNTEYFRELSRAGSDAGSSIMNSFGPVKPYMERLFGSGAKGTGVSEFVTETLTGADAANNFERNIVSLAASTGSLNEVFAGGTFTTEALDREYSSMTEHLFNVANATGHTMQETMAYANALGTIPGALKTNIAVTEDLGGEMTQLEASLKLASAYGLKHGEVVNDLSKMYQQFGTRGNEAFQSLNAIYKASQDVGLPLKTVNDMVLQGANNFMLLGDNIQAATNVVKVFGEAFKNSNLGPEAIKRVVDSMISGIAGMKEGTKAFISSQTGGPGGLAGGFQMDLALQEGKMDEVLGKTMQAMQRQFGTSPITLKEAGSNQQMAGEFYKQVSYLKDVAGIAKSNDEAYRILEAMKTGATGDLQLGAREGKDELSSSLDRGAEMQSRSNTVLNRISTTLEYQKMIQAKTQQDVAISTLGIGILAGTSNKDYAKKFTTAGAQTGGLGIAQGSTQSRSLDQQIQSGAEWMMSANNYISTLKGIGNDYIKKGQNFVKNMQDEMPKFPNAAGGKDGKLPQLPPVNIRPAPLDVNIVLDIPELKSTIRKQVKTELKAQKQAEGNQALTGSDDEVSM